MSLPTNGITQDVIRDMMAPYHLSGDLLEATLGALPPPPHDAPASWRHARITRLVEEIATLMPANAAQARIAAQILVLRERADALTSRSYAPELTVEQMCRLSRAADALARTAVALERALARHQQKPAAFFGTVMADAVDVAALDAAWCDATPARAGEDPLQRANVPAVMPAGEPVGDAAPIAVFRPEPTPGQPDVTPPAEGAGWSPVVTTVKLPADRAASLVRAQRERFPDAAARPPAGTAAATQDADARAATGVAA